jgi:HNH endonuclease
LVDIAGFEGVYAVTEEGLIWSYPKTWIGNNGSHQHHDGKFLKPFKRGDKNKQYFIVELKDKPFLVHRLIAETFIPNPLNLPYINHRDLNRFNNHKDNLEWCTQEENIQHAEMNGAMKHFYGENHGNHKLKTFEINEIRELRASGYTLKQLSERYNTSKSNISIIYRREGRKYG